MFDLLEEAEPLYISNRNNDLKYHTAFMDTLDKITVSTNQNFP